MHSLIIIIFSLQIYSYNQETKLIRTIQRTLDEHSTIKAKPRQTQPNKNFVETENRIPNLQAKFKSQTATAREDKELYRRFDQI